MNETFVESTNTRAHMLRSSMLYASASVLFVSLTVLSLFAEQLLQLHRDFIALELFALCLISLVVSMYYSIRDITVSLAALDLEVSDRLRGNFDLSPVRENNGLIKHVKVKKEIPV